MDCKCQRVGLKRQVYQPTHTFPSCEMKVKGRGNQLLVEFKELGLKSVASSTQLTAVEASKATGETTEFKVMSRNVRWKDNQVMLLTFVRLPRQ